MLIWSAKFRKTYNGRVKEMDTSSSFTPMTSPVHPNAIWWSEENLVAIPSGRYIGMSGTDVTHNAAIKPAAECIFATATAGRQSRIGSVCATRT